MDNYFDKVKEFLLELDYPIKKSDEQSGILVIEKEEELIKNMVLVIEGETLVIMQRLFELKKESVDVLKDLLRLNLLMVSGALALDETNVVVYRDTLQLENLDKNELAASIEALTLLLSEYGEQLLKYGK